MVEKEIQNMLEIIEDRLKVSSDKAILYFSGELYEYKYNRLDKNIQLGKELDIIKFLENKDIIRLEYRVEIDRAKSKTNTVCSIVPNVSKLKNHKRYLLKKMARENRASSRGNMIFLESDEGNGCSIQLDGNVNTLKKNTKGYALVKILTENMDTPLTIKEIKQFCNPLITKSEHFFKKERDIDDAIREIKVKLKVGKKAYFPIIKQNTREIKSWKLVTKSG